MIWSFLGATTSLLPNKVLVLIAIVYAEVQSHDQELESGGNGSQSGLPSPVECNRSAFAYVFASNLE